VVLIQFLEVSGAELVLAIQVYVRSVFMNRYTHPSRYMEITFAIQSCLGGGAGSNIGQGGGQHLEKGHLLLSLNFFLGGAMFVNILLYNGYSLLVANTVRQISAWI
jgi:hypothetical protein